MKRENINYLAVGLFVIVIMSAFFVVVYKITGRTGPTDHYFVTYDNVTGIKYGTPVSYEGYQVGQVELIEPVYHTARRHTRSFQYESIAFPRFQGDIRCRQSQFIDLP